jgi:ABC-2 type transport system ATP-binding protein
MALQDLSLQVPEGSIYGFLGPNGAGKSTAIRILLGFLQPTQGQARILGRDCWRESCQIKAEVGYVPGDLRLYPWMTGARALDLVAKVREKDMRARSAELLERFQLDPSVTVRHMSRGMRQKLGLLMALAPDPRLLILDEPTTALDPLMQDQLMQCLRESAAKGRTVFFSSHSLAEVEQICNHIAILRDGVLVADESLASLRQRAKRIVLLTLPEGHSPAPELLSVVEHHGEQWRCELLGPVPALLQWLASQPVTDVTVGAPDLETIFRSYY